MADKNVFLFDLDETLLDFHASEYIGLKNVVTAQGFEFTEELYKYFKTRNKELWLELEKGSITRPELFRTRFRLLFERCGAETDKIDLLGINSDFISEMSRNGVLIEGALEFLQRLRKGIPACKIYVVTNGATINAWGRVRSTGIDKLIDGMFVSEDMGVNKPAKEYFDIVLRSIKEPKENCIVIGDSLSSDMRGAKNAGIDSCWFRPEGDVAAAMKEYEIKYTAADYEELYDVLTSRF